MKTSALPRRATLYRMVMPKHVCPYGLKAKDLLQREGYQVEDRWLHTREETEAFKLAHQVKTTPQILIGEERVGGYDVLRRRLGKRVPDP
jgi:glutaredoxin